ncbi:sensor histidine kinase [Actinomadura rupiterrae]|uniref:sensor histidine kinase n=1 Tax=Actinomadura rupiterrae TaxID=559627 RepID=UPI0020A31FFE|nr:HAMP domain-containing sensor histidine kinase [Actinomadura rupiterrae]MCP2342105.1 two-component system sensor histidine kinase VanS [Actinomadura rupiterrae]
MTRRPGLSARLKFTLSYAGFLMFAGAILLAVIGAYMVRYAPWALAAPDGRLARSVRLRLLPATAMALAFLLVFGLVGGWLLAGRMLAPLTRITEAARMAADGSLSHRIRLKGPSDEFRELADVFDTMLEQLESHITEQQRFAANASHELRTPLAISRALLDVAPADLTQKQRELIDRLRTVNTRAIDLTEALLLLSRADRKSFTRSPVDLSLIAEEATETLLPFAEQRQITLHVTGEATHALGSAELLLQMVTNLVQNAIVHNLPSDGMVRVHTTSQCGASVLQVENTGQQIPPELLPTLTEPFQRGAERARTDGHAGVGLGLAIVHSIVRAHQGTLDLAPRPTGGLLVTIRLPEAHAGTPHQPPPSSEAPLDR